MKFGELALSQARGAILAHSVRATGVAFKKGRVLTASDVDRLARADIKTVVAARLEAGDVGEDEAAARIAAAVAGENIRASAAATGRCNLQAGAAGLILYHREVLDGINLVDEAATIAAVAEFEPVEPGQIVATIKIIPFAAPGRVVAAVEAAAAKAAPVLRLAPFQPVKAGLVQSRLPGTKDSVLDKTRDAVSQRLERRGSVLAEEIRCGHDATSVAEALVRLKKSGCGLVMAMGASAITDRRDVVPGAILTAGGRIEHLGMPVDPGNLLLLGSLDDKTPALGLPGCARSPKVNGFDWVLDRLLAGQKVTAADIKRMGAGGLLKDVPGRPLPRGKATVISGNRST